MRNRFCLAFAVFTTGLVLPCAVLAQAAGTAAPTPAVDKADAASSAATDTPAPATGPAAEAPVPAIAEPSATPPRGLSEGTAEALTKEPAMPEGPAAPAEEALPTASPVPSLNSDRLDPANPLLPAEPLPEGEFVPDSRLLAEPLPGGPGRDSAAVRPPPASTIPATPPGSNLRDQLAMRKARIKALGDPKVQDALAGVDESPYFPEQQAAWKNYYDVLFKRMQRIDSSLTRSIKRRENQLKGRFLPRPDPFEAPAAVKPAGAATPASPATAATAADAADATDDEPAAAEE